MSQTGYSFILCGDCNTAFIAPNNELEACPICGSSNLSGHDGSLGGTLISRTKSKKLAKEFAENGGWTMVSSKRGDGIRYSVEKFGYYD